MGDIWPYGPPLFVTYGEAEAALRDQGMPASDANIGAAIGQAESSLDYRVINDTPATGDYSVGIWQINYYGSLYAPRSREFGTPQMLVKGGLIHQAFACHALWATSGFTPWSTYNSGAYRKYLGGGIPGAVSPGSVTFAIPVPTNPGKDSWSGQVKAAAGHFDGSWHMLGTASQALKILRG